MSEHRKSEAERKADEASAANLRRSLATENLVSLEEKEVEARRKAEEKRIADEKVETVSVMVRALEPGFNVGHRRRDEIFSYEGARVGDEGPVLPSWVAPLTDAELVEVAEKEAVEAQYPPEYRLSLGQSSSAPPAPGMKPTQMRNPADGVKTTGEMPRTLSEGSKALDPGNNPRHGSFARGAKDSGADLV